MNKTVFLTAPLLFTIFILSLTAAPLHEAVQKGNRAETKRLLSLKEPLARVNEYDKQGYTPLLRAILLPVNKDLETIIGLLLEHGADPTLRSEKHIITKSTLNDTKQGSRGSVTVEAAKSPFVLLALKEKEDQHIGTKSALALFFEYGSFYFDGKEITLEGIQELQQYQLEAAIYRPLEAAIYRPRKQTEEYKKRKKEERLSRRREEESGKTLTLIRKKMKEFREKYSKEQEDPYSFVSFDSSFHSDLAKATKDFSEWELTRLFTQAEQFYLQEKDQRKTQTFTKEYFNRALEELLDNEEDIF